VNINASNNDFMNDEFDGLKKMQVLQVEMATMKQDLKLIQAS
jgi:hypothetical protein